MPAGGGGCAVLGLPHSLLSGGGGGERPPRHPRAGPAPEDADASPGIWLCALPLSPCSAQSPPLPSCLLLPPLFYCSPCVFHAGTLRNAWGAPGFASPVPLPRAEAVGVAVGTAVWVPGAGGAPTDRGPPPTLPPWQPPEVCEMGSWGGGVCHPSPGLLR